MTEIRAGRHAVEMADDLGHGQAVVDPLGAGGLDHPRRQVDAVEAIGQRPQQRPHQPGAAAEIDGVGEALLGRAVPVQQLQQLLGRAVAQLALELGLEMRAKPSNRPRT